MANRYRNLIYSNAEYTHTYNGFRGIELNASSLTTSQKRLSYAQNMYKDYDGDGADVIESIPGFRCFAHYGEAIHSLYYQRSANGGEDHLIVHVKNKLIRHPVSHISESDAKGVEIATLEDAKSFGFAYGRYFYVMDTKRILQIDNDGVCRLVGDSGAFPYIPTTYVSGETYEQRNLLINDFKEEFYVQDPTAYLYSSKGLKFVITDPYERYCTVKGVADSKGDIYMPAYVNIAGVDYKVISIDDYAFSGNTAITAVYLPEGIMKIGAQAFSGCTALKTAVISSTVTEIKERAFFGCTAMNTLYLGTSVASVGQDAISNTYSLASIHYALTEEDLGKIEGADALKTRSIMYSSRYEAIKIALPFHDNVSGIIEVRVNGEAVSYGTTGDNVSFDSVTLAFPSIADATGIRVVIWGTLHSLGSDWAADMTSLSSVSPYQAIINCRIAEVFDGRIFFSGNPSFPNTVFYTERVKQNHDGALYVGRYNYFNDGVGSYRVRSILAVRDMLAVFKEGDDGSGSIFYHKKEDTGIDTLTTIYPVAYVHSGICSSGNALSFLDDPVFLTNEGLMALNGENINYQRNVVCRSHNVNYTLLKEDLSHAHLCEWLGYLVIGIGDKMFLADSRASFVHPAGSREYEWFLASEIGAYTGDEAVYRYSPDEYADASVHPTLVGTKARHKEVFSESDAYGTTYYYVKDSGTKYRVIPTDERDGGVFHPADIFISHGNRLFFTSTDGHLCVFNNDLRGVAPDSVRNSDSYNEDEYLATMGTKIHPLFYSFTGHAPTYVVRTALDDCGVPHLTKSTVKKSLVIKAKSHSSRSIECEVTCDGADPMLVDSFPYVGSAFDDFDFTDAPWSISRYASSTLPENEKRWIEKQITLKSSSFASPISVYSIAYRYVIKGKIKNNV